MSLGLFLTFLIWAPFALFVVFALCYSAVTDWWKAHKR